MGPKAARFKALQRIVQAILLSLLITLSCITGALAVDVGDVGEVASGEGATPINGRNYRMAGDSSRTRIVVDFDREPNPRWFLLRNPHRLVVDLRSEERRVGEVCRSARDGYMMC